jgi:predicted acyl esterase
MIVERDVAIPTDDGLKLRADIFRPNDGKPAPVIMTQGPYGKGVEYKTGYKAQWEWLLKTHPDILPNSTKSFMTWETVDPEIWTSWGYVCIRVDSRGTGRTPGFLDIFSPRESKDYYEAIEWSAHQPWSNGKVGLLGISYYAISQWLVASLQPPHLAAMIPWEGAADNYRDVSRHGGIASNAFLEAWYKRQVVSNQHGNAKCQMDPWMLQAATGPEELSEEDLLSNRTNPVKALADHPLDDQYYRERSADWSKITVPFLSAANVGGFGLHGRGNYEAFTRAAATQKWLEIHPGRHEEWFYLKHSMDMQKRFLDHFLKGIDNGWTHEPPVLLRLRRPFSSDFELRKEPEWPLRSTQWTKIYFEASNKKLSWEPAKQKSSIAFEALGKPVTFMSAPLDHETEITGPMAAKLFISSSTSDADLFLTLQAFSPEGKEVDFQGSLDPHTPLAQGWLRASHRKLDSTLSLPYRPYHIHDEIQALEANKIYELMVEIWPTCIILPPGFQIALQISGHDFVRAVEDPDGSAFTGSGGSGPFLHTLPEDRPTEVFGGKTTVYTGGENESYLLLPIIKH